MYSLCLLRWDNLWSAKLTTGNDSEATTGSWTVDFRYLLTYNWHLLRQRKWSKLQCLFSVRAGHRANWPAGACGDDFARLVLPSSEKVFLQRGSIKNILLASENQLPSDCSWNPCKTVPYSNLVSIFHSLFKSKEKAASFKRSYWVHLKKFWA